MKKFQAVYGAPRGHWVGDGFPVRSLLSYDRLGAEHISPFLLLDHAGPHRFGPTRYRRGVGAHTHRGFETVTLVYQGALEHRDSAGHGGQIGEGGVQWMTAGAGLVHEEYHAPAFAEGGEWCSSGSTCLNQTTRDAAWDRMSQAGAQLMTWFGVGCELHRDWRNDIEGFGGLLAGHLPAYANLMQSYNQQSQPG